MEIKKVMKGQWIVEKDGDQVFSAKTKKECEQFIENLPEPEAVQEPVQKEPKKKKQSEIVTVLNELVLEGRYTRKELLQLTQEKLPSVKSITINTYLSDCKNPKYNHLRELVSVDDNGIFHFLDTDKGKSNGQ